VERQKGTKFIAVNDQNNKPRRLKISRISQWNRVFHNMGGQYREATEVRYGRENITLLMPVREFDILFEMAGGTLTHHQPQPSKETV